MVGNRLMFRKGRGFASRRDYDRSLWLITMLFVLITASFSEALGQERAPRKLMIQQLVEPAIGYRKTVGIVVGVVTRDSREVYAFGKTGRSDKSKLDGDTVFEIGSITKVLTTIMLADMAAHQELGLLDPVDKYLPSEVKVPGYNKSHITLFDLATHTSGLPRQPTNLVPKNVANPFVDYTVADLYEFLSGFKLNRAIGSQYEYSNTGLGLLGQVMSLKTGKSYEDLVISRICEPLGMSSTRVQLTAQMKDRLAMGHNRWGEPAQLWDLPALAGAGALRSTVNDLNRFVAANLNLQECSIYPSMLNSHIPRVRIGYEDQFVGLGWKINPGKFGEIVSHEGSTGGYASYIGFAKKYQTGVVLLTNFGLGDDAAILGANILEKVIGANP